MRGSAAVCISSLLNEMPGYSLKQLQLLEGKQEKAIKRRSLCFAQSPHISGVSSQMPRCFPPQVFQLKLHKSMAPSPPTRGLRRTPSAFLDCLQSHRKWAHWWSCLLCCYEMCLWLWWQHLSRCQICLANLKSCVTRMAPLSANIILAGV